MTLTEFLLARIAEDGRYIADFNPARYVVAECEAKRQLVELANGALCDRGFDDDGKYISSMVLRWLAFPYADHADYQQEWKPDWRP